MHVDRPHQRIDEGPIMDVDAFHNTLLIGN